jgi:sulfoxide reductase catalytic subunit YedY
MNRRVIVIVVLAVGLAALAALAAGGAAGSERVQLKPDTPKSAILRMNPSEADPSLLPLDSIEDLNTTGGAPPDIDIGKWRLSVKGKKARNSLSLSYDELAGMEQVKKRVILICPGVFVDYAEWEGVPLGKVLEAAKVREGFTRVTIRSEDGFSSSFTKEHGFPVRLVAEDILGGSWVKWVKTIEVE